MKKKIKDIIGFIMNVLLIVIVVLMAITLIQEIILNYKVAKQDDCIELNNNYYCKIDKEK